MILLFFVAARFRKHIADGLLDMEFSLIGATLVGEISFVILVVLTRSMKWGMAAGLIGMILGGFLLNFIDFGSGGGDFD